MKPFEPFHAKVTRAAPPIIVVTEECFVTQEMVEDGGVHLVHQLLVNSLRGRLFVRDLVLVGVGDVVLHRRSTPDPVDSLLPDEHGVYRAVLLGWAIKGELLVVPKS